MGSQPWGGRKGGGDPAVVIIQSLLVGMGEGGGVP